MIGLMDCNNFFVSCERLFRPDLVGKPVAVLSSNDGCVIARSQEVKDLGIPMGIPYFEVKKMCDANKITLFSSNLTLYRDISARVMRALKDEFEMCEVYSVDEAFFTVDNTITEEKLMEIRARIMQKTGIPVSIGVASTKTRAKIASKIAKTRKGDGRLTMSAIEGVCILDEKLWKDVQKELSCGSVWGIGRQTAAFLSKARIYTVSELLSQDRAFITQALGVVGERLCMELNGISVYALGSSESTEQESYTSTRSFGHPVTDKMTLMSALSHHTASVAEKLRHDACVASKITIILRGSRFGLFAHRNGVVSSVLAVPTNDTATLTKEVLKLCNTLYDTEIPYKKAGVIVSSIEPIAMSSTSLFDSEKEKISVRALNEVTDFLNQKFGHGTIRSGYDMGTEKWKERTKMKSREYTTRWSEIPSVKAK